MSTKNELRNQIIREMNARRIDHKTYINSEWLLSEYEKALDAEIDTNTMSTKTDDWEKEFDTHFGINKDEFQTEYETHIKQFIATLITTLRKEQDEAYTKGYNAGLADGTGKPLLAIEQIREEAVAEAYEKGQMESRLSEHKERLDLWDEAITEGRRRERLGILNVLDGLKEVYTADAKTEDGETYALKGEEKEHSDSERNETIDEVIEALAPQNTKTDSV